MSKLTVILGAGFSYEAGLPLGKDIQVRFDRDLREKFLTFSSSEWMWIDDKSDADIHNGTLYHKHYWYSYIFNEYVIEYKKEKGSFIDYEDFYQFIIDLGAQSVRNKAIFDNAKSKLFQEHPEFNGDHMFSHLYEMPNYYLPVEILNYLIWDLLRFGKSDTELLSLYQPFIDLIKAYDEIDIFTLNHDLLVEFLLENNGISYTKGFSNISSAIQYEGNPLPTYKGDYEKFKVRLYKMHGSTDCYQFEHLNQNGPHLSPTGIFSYYLPGGYRARHSSVRIDPSTGDILQDFCPDAVPKFITGKDKMNIINKDYMYSDLYERFSNIIKKTNNLFISGYSFRDEHINKGIEKCKAKNILNQNPSTIFPFEKENTQIRFLRELPSILI